MTNSVPEHEVVVAPIEALRAGFAELVRELAREAVAERGRFSLAVPGGSVAEMLLTGLSTESAAWEKTELFWCDERVVPADHRDSNYGSARAGWLRELGDAPLRAHAMVPSMAPLDRLAASYANELTDSLGASPVFDLMVVGVGEDGHVCSLFPGRPELEEVERLVVGVEDAPKLPRQRLTLTLPLVTGARCLVVAAFGFAKKDAMRCAIEEPTCILPVARALRGSRRAVILLDEASASTLTAFRRASGT